MEYRYRQRRQPGCGGCLFVLILFLLLAGGTPLLFDVLGMIFFSGLTMLFIGVAAFWGFTFYVKRKISEYESSQSESHNNFVDLLVRILVRIAQADGVVSREEINTIQNFFQYNLHYSSHQLAWVKELIKEAQESDVELNDLLASFKAGFAYEPRLILVELIYQVIYSKSPVADHELQLAQRVAIYLELSAYDLQSIRAKFVNRTASQAAAAHSDYDTLGLSPGADFAEIKKAYRKLSMQYHPDKVGHLGEEFQKVAEEKMKDINVAYQNLKDKHGR